MEVFSDGSHVIDDFGCTEGSLPGGDLTSCTIEFFTISNSVSSDRSKSKLLLPSQWRIQDFPDRGGRATPKVEVPTYYLVKIFPKTA